MNAYQSKNQALVNISGFTMGRIVLETRLEASRMFNFIMYADDTTLTSTINTFNGNTNNDNVETSLNAELLKINEWLQINKLS